MAETFRQDGKSVDVVAPAGGVTKGDAVLAQGFHGIAMADAAAGETVALEVESRVHALNVGALTAAKGDQLYISAAGALTTTNTDRYFGRVVRAKDSNNVAWVRLAAQ